MSAQIRKLKADNLLIDYKMNNYDYQRLFDCTDDIYQTINDQTHWQAVLQQLSQIVNDGRGVIISKNNETGHIDVLDAFHTKAYRFSYRYLGRYLNRVHLVDEWTSIEKKHGLGEVCIFNDHLPLNALRKTRFYTQWLKPQNISGGMAIQIFNVQRFRVIFYIVYDDDSESVDVLYQSLLKLSPHLCRATSLWMSSIGIENNSESSGRFEYLMNRYKLTKRELEVTSALTRASTVQLAANSLHISESTVKSEVL